MGLWSGWIAWSAGMSATPILCYEACCVNNPAKIQCKESWLWCRLKSIKCAHPKKIISTQPPLYVCLFSYLSLTKV